MQLIVDDDSHRSIFVDGSEVTQLAGSDTGSFEVDTTFANFIGAVADIAQVTAVDGVVFQWLHHQNLQCTDIIAVAPHSQVSSGFIHIVG